MTSQELQIEVNRICTLISSFEVEQREEILLQELQKITDQHAREAVLSLVTVAVRFTKDVAEKKMPTRDKIGVGLFGVAFLITLLVIALFIPQPSEFQIFVFRLILSIAAAGVAATIPGALDVHGTVKNFTIRAGGAIAVFIIVYLINPPGLIHH